jgi:hypothetical protein
MPNKQLSNDIMFLLTTSWSFIWVKGGLVCGIQERPSHQSGGKPLQTIPLSTFPGDEINLSWRSVYFRGFLKGPEQPKTWFYICVLHIQNSQKFGHTYSFKGFSLFFYYFLQCRITVKSSKLWNNTHRIK